MQVMNRHTKWQGELYPGRCAQGLGSGWEGRVGKAIGWDLGDLGSVPSAMLLRQLRGVLLTTACFLVGVTYLLLVEGRHL